jgi:hypothetical protein
MVERVTHLSINRPIVIVYNGKTNGEIVPGKASVSQVPVMDRSGFITVKETVIFQPDHSKSLEKVIGEDPQHIFSKPLAWPVRADYDPNPNIDKDFS